MMVLIKITWSSPQSGLIGWSLNPIDLGFGGSFNFPSDTLKYGWYVQFNNAQIWQADVPPGYYVFIIIYNVNTSNPPSFTLEVAGQQVIPTHCGAIFKLNNNIQNSTTTMTCCSFDNTQLQQSAYQVGKACTCSYITSCNNCPGAITPAWGFAFDYTFAPPSPPPSLITKADASYIFTVTAQPPPPPPPSLITKADANCIFTITPVQPPPPPPPSLITKADASYIFTVTAQPPPPPPPSPPPRGGGGIQLNVNVPDAIISYLIYILALLFTVNIIVLVRRISKTYEKEEKET